jgi:hypothetical protein
MGIVRAKIKGTMASYRASRRRVFGQWKRECFPLAENRSRVRPSNCHERGQEMAKVGDKVPSATLRMLGPEGPKPMTTEELFAPGKKVVVFALPGAFTPT